MRQVILVIKKDQPDKPVSRQRAWQLKKLSEGKCASCGGLGLFTKNRCKKCAIAHRESTRKILGFRKWTPGCRGRVPAEKISVGITLAIKKLKKRLEFTEKKAIQYSNESFGIISKINELQVQQLELKETKKNEHS